MNSTCLVCSAAIEPFLSFGRMPVANGFLSESEFADEFFYDLAVGFCDHCSMVQLTQPVERERLFHDNYAYFSSISTRMAAHFEEFARSVTSQYLATSDPFVVEIGSNDGIMLRHFAEAQIRHLGIEPSANVAQVAIDRGINTICKFFDADLAREIVNRHGHANAILAANVMCHIADLHTVAEGMRILLGRQGIAQFEDPYLGSILEKTAYDQIYDEHVYYFSISSVQRLFSDHGLELIDVASQSVHGGSMRYTLAPQGARPVTNAVVEQQRREAAWGLARAETFDKFRAAVERSRDRLSEVLREAHKNGKRVVGYGATSKSTTVTNYCDLSPQLIEFISDTTPGKQGKYSPGVHVLVRPYEAFAANYPEYALLFAWNHAEEIMAKERDFTARGGKWIMYVPEVTVV